MPQPTWKLIANLGDVNPVDYGGYFVFVDETGVYDPEAELLVSPDSDDAQDGGWTVYRFSLDRCTLTDGVLSDNAYHPDHPAWFATPERERKDRPQDTTYLAEVARFAGWTVPDLQAALCAEDPVKRAQAYYDVGNYHGFENLDSYPLTFTKRKDVEARYADVLAELEK